MIPAALNSARQKNRIARSSKSVVWLALGILCIGESPTRGQDDADEGLAEIGVAPGLVATYSCPAGSVARIDEQLQSSFALGKPGLVKPNDAASLRWEGLLRVESPGVHRIEAFVAGRIRVELANQEILNATSAESSWVAAEPIELEYGWQPLAVEFRPSIVPATVGIYWSGPDFPLEPIPPRFLGHLPGASRENQFETGESLWSWHRCGACHDDTTSHFRAAPSLAHQVGQFDRAWLTAWLSRDVPGAVTVGNSTHNSPHHIPALNISTDEVASLTAWLGTSSDKPARADATQADPGRRLFLSLGCLSCHTWRGVGDSSPWGGGDLTAIASKRPTHFFERWLAQPAALNPDHRMPVFELSDEERRHLADFLSVQGERSVLGDDHPPSAENQNKADSELLNRGLTIAGGYRCDACHQLPDAPRSRPRTAVAISGQGRSCLEPHQNRFQPTYELSDTQRQALLDYIESRESVPQITDAGRTLVSELRCTGCHQRGAAPGLAATTRKVAELIPELAGELPLLTPPGLDAVGDKLTATALRVALLAGDRRRPWLRVRMPRFQLSDEERSQIIKYFQASDQLPPRADDPPPSEPHTPDRAIAGSRLVTSDGFGCTSCHQIGKSIPFAVAPGAHGSDLSLIGGRVHRAWFQRWLRNPARMAPRMEMPAIAIPVPGVLQDELSAQVDSIWQVLNEPGFSPPLPDPVRTLRTTNAGSLDERAVIVSDLLSWDSGLLIRPLVIGLPHRHNIVLDLNAGSWIGWYLGDTARQRALGKGWQWEPGGANLLESSESQAEFTVRSPDGRWHKCIPWEDGNLALLDGWRHVPQGAEFWYRLKFSCEDHGDVEIEVRQRWSSVTRDQKSDREGFDRRVTVRNLPAGYRIGLLPGPSAPSSLTSTKGRGKELQLAGGGSLECLPVAGVESANDGSAPGRFTSLVARAHEPIVFELAYRTNLAADRYLAPIPPAVVSESRRLPVAAGFNARQLGLPRDHMPTALAWASDGSMIYTTLKGSVERAIDNDHDGLADTTQTIMDGLPAPYGLSVNGKSIDVLVKFGLLRLINMSDDGTATQAQIVADGWGYTADYHDWAVGLPPDGAGGYFVALPCQQDERSPALARWRGTILRLQPTHGAGPRPYKLEQVARGLRFPMGMAVSVEGDLLVTDNQGNYNPFNELNRIVPGGHYGFINRLDQGQTPPTSVTPAAIEIPHPWVRSVNGICFLPSGDEWGKFAGHLIGCEYDTRRLIRISLQHVGDTLQGAVYPLGVPTPEPQAGLEGPVTCQIGPDGGLYVGNLRDSGWGGGQNTGSIVRIVPDGPLPPGIAEVRARQVGFEVQFTQPINEPALGEIATYQIEDFRRESTSEYGSPDLDRHTVAVRAVKVHPGQDAVTLEVVDLREGFLYEIRVPGLARQLDGFHPAEAFYTLRRKP